MLFLIKPTLQLKSLLGQTAFSCVGGNLIRTVSRRILSLGKDFKAFSSRQWIRDSVCPPRISSRLKEPYATSRSWWQIGGLLINLIIQPNWARVGLEAPFMIYSESFYSEKFHSFFFLLNTLKKQSLWFSPRGLHKLFLEERTLFSRRHSPGRNHIFSLKMKFTLTSPVSHSQPRAVLQIWIGHLSRW